MKLKKEIDEDIRRWKDFQCSWNSRISTVKTAILQRNLQIQHNSHQTSYTHLYRNFKDNFQLHIEPQNIQDS